MRQRSVQAVPLHRRHCSVHCCPGQHLGVDELLWLTANLPHAPVRVLPASFENLHQRPLQVPSVLLAGDAAIASLVQAVHDLAVDVQLQLPACCVASPDRSAAGVPVEWDVAFGDAALAGYAVEDLQLLGVPRSGPQ